MRKESSRYVTIAQSSGIQETKDCVVRAMSLACNVRYEDMHKVCKQFGRKDKHGTALMTVFKVAEHNGMSLASRYCSRASDGPTVAQFVAANPKGHYYVQRKGHAFAVIDGVVHDWVRGTGARTRVTLAYKAPM